MARLKTIPSRLAKLPPRLKTQSVEGGWSGREALLGNRHARGYGTAWDRLRKVILVRDKYLCQVCLSMGRPEPATQVDHIVPKSQGGTDDQSNCQSICTACHKAKTAKESKHGNGHL